MKLNEMTDTERGANAAAEFFPAVDEADNNGAYAHPCMQVSGAQVYAYVQDGTLVVSVDLDTVSFPLHVLADNTVPVQVKVSGVTVYYEGERTTSSG